MSFNYKIVRCIALSLFALHVTTLFPLSKPIIKDGRYYYSADDTYEHIDTQRALKFLGKRVLSPAQWKKAVTSFVNATFYSVKGAKESPLMPKPMQTIPAQQSIEPIITWIGHASILIQINGFNILTDPVFGDVKAGPVTLTKRAMKPGINFDDLPPIDAILISHNHSDHTDTNSLMAIQQKYHSAIFVPQGDKALFESMGFSRVIECMWWSKYKLIKKDRTMMVTFLPAYHWSIRFSLSSYRKSLWGGWMISDDDTNIYFAGDTAYGPLFKEIARQFPSIDVAFLPIGPTSKGVNKHIHSHVDAKEAVDAFIDLNAQTFIPIHYGTFFSKDHLQYPLPLLQTTWKEKQALLQDKQLLVAHCGESYKVYDME